MHPRLRAPVSMLLVLATASAPLLAFAGPAEDKATARELATAGIALEEKGDCKGAIDKLERAETLFHAPPHLQHLARCYTKLGRLVDATEAWRKLTLEALPPTAPDVFKAAVAEAQVELPKIEPRLAHLTIKPAATYEGLEVTVDGKKWPSAALDVSRVIDPGKHDVHATASAHADFDKSITLPEGGTDTVEIKLQPGTPSTAASVVPTSSASTNPTTDKPGMGGLRVTGLVAAGVGAAMLIGGTFTGLSAKSKFNEVESACPNKRCPAGYDLAGNQSSVKSLERTTNILLIGGGVLAVAGLAIFVFAPSPGTGVALQASPNVGGAHISLSGSF